MAINIVLLIARQNLSFFELSKVKLKQPANSSNKQTRKTRVGFYHIFNFWFGYLNNFDLWLNNYVNGNEPS